MDNRKVRKGKAKDYQRNAKLYDYYYITVNNKDFNLKMNGWDDNHYLDIKKDQIGKYVIIDNKNYYLNI